METRTIFLRKDWNHLDSGEWREVRSDNGRYSKESWGHQMRDAVLNWWVQGVKSGLKIRMKANRNCLEWSWGMGGVTGME